MLLFGYLVGQALGWGTMDSVFLGGMLSMSSTTIIIKAFDDLGVRKERFAQLVFGTLVIEDIAGIFMMIILSTISVGQGISGMALALKLGMLVLYLALWLILGIYLLPTLLNKASPLMSDETLLVVSLGLCFGMVLLADALGFSSALGAFLAGSLLAGTVHAERVEHLTSGVKDLFGAVFFISVGMMLDLSFFLQHIWAILFNTLLFFATALGVGLVVHYAMKWLDQRNPHTQRITIVSMAFCFAMAYIAEEYFGIADITGAYIAGIVLCTMDDAPYVERRVDISNYVIFAPIFFASIGLKTDISGLTPEILLFCVCFVVVALITKIIGCGLAAKVCRFNWDDSLKVGVGMMTRGEVALIVAQKGLAIGVVDPVYFTAVILLIVVSSVATPLALKAMFTKHPPVPHPSQAK